MFEFKFKVSIATTFMHWKRISLLLSRIIGLTVTNHHPSSCKSHRMLSLYIGVVAWMNV
jgi:hypothetical protein